MNFSARRPVPAICIAIAAAIACAIASSRLKPDTSLKSLFPRDDPAAAALLHVLDHFPSAEEMLVLATAEHADPKQLIAFAQRLKRQIDDDPTCAAMVSAYNYRTEAESREFVAKVIVPNAIFYLSDAQFEAARHRLTHEEMSRQLKQDESMLGAPGPAAGGMAKAVMQDPLRLHEFIEDRLGTKAPFQTYQNSDAFISPDGRSLLIRIAGKRPPSDLKFCREFTSRITALAERANEDRLSIEYSGAYPIAARSESSIRKDSIESVAGSVSFLLILFILAFRRPVLLFVITFAPVALGAVYGFGVFALINRSVTPLTAVIGAMLAGIGIDYSIFYVVNYLHRLGAGRRPVDAAIDTISSIGGALMAAWVTSVVGFIAVGFASIPALRDFSILGSLGLAGALGGTIFILPALLVLLSRGLRFSNCRLPTVPLLNFIDRHSTRCLASWSILLIASVAVLAWYGPFLELETDPTIMHPRPNPPLDAEADIARRMAGAPDSLIVYLHANSPEELLVLAHRVDARLQKSTDVASMTGLASLLPDPRLEQQRINESGKHLSAQVESDFDSAIAQSSFNGNAFDSYKIFLRTLLTSTRAPQIEDLVPYNQLARNFLPGEVFIGATAVESITLVRLVESRSPRQAITALRRLLADIPGATLTGMSVLSLDTEMTIHRDMPRLIAAAVAICAIYLLLHFRSLPLGILAVLPTLCSLICLLAAARITGAKMNLANMISIPLLIGVDIDYGIFLVSAARHCKSRAELIERVAASSQAVILCAAATTLGFGSLAFTSVPAVRSLGWAVGVGVVSCALAALFALLPLMLRMRPRVIAALLLAFPFICMSGCAAPTGRLTFPSEPSKVSGDIEWFDVRHNGSCGFGIVHDASGQVDRLLYDDRGSGHIDREYRLSDYSNERVPHLILLLDSIPFETMNGRFRSGDFGWFDAPQKMIAPFPSLTEVCYSDVLHAPPLPGATDQYFDPRDQEKKDILWTRVEGFEQPWERRVAYHANYLEQGLSFLDPDAWYAAELEKARLALEHSPDRVTIVYIASAASMVCKYGRAGAEKVLDGARQLCLQLLYERRGAIKITMMADHGHNYMPSKNVSLEHILKQAGLNPTEKISDDRDCVVEINALVTRAAVHTIRPTEAAAALCRHKEIELAVYMDGPRAIIQSAAGRSAVECRDGMLRYVPLDADVLDYLPLIGRLKSEGAMDGEGFASEKTWFNQTLDNPWPNVPRRVWDALHGRFITTPTVLVSLKDGYYAGYQGYERYIKMASTHGGLNQMNSATFVMTMTGRLHEAVRHEEVISQVEPGFEPRVQR